MSSVLLGETGNDGDGDVTKGIEVHAKVEGATLTLAIQKVTEGIKVCASSLDICQIYHITR